MNKFLGPCAFALAAIGIVADANAQSICTSNRECADEAICNGAEYCLPAHPLADVRGCVTREIDRPCAAAGQTCVEPERAGEPPRCVGAVREAPAACRDEDGDGHRDVSCGGDDCDDDDRDRFPGNAEYCEGTLRDGRARANHDEDCNAATVAGPYPDGDADYDRHISNQCANRAPNNNWITGGDCMDDNISIAPGSMACATATRAMVCGLTIPVAGYGLRGGAWTFGFPMDCAPGEKCVTQPNKTGVCVPAK